MKKYITITSLLVAGTAFSNAATVSFENETTAAVAVLTLNVDEFKNINGSYFNGASEVVTLFKFTGTWADATTGYLGAANNGSSTSGTTSIFTSWQKGSSARTNTSTGLPILFNSETDWDRITGISLAYSFNGTVQSGKSATLTNVAVSIVYADGTITTEASTQSNVVFAGVYGFTASGLETNETYVDSYRVEFGDYTLDDVKNRSIAAIPEPSAFGLLAGIGALALVASRRRRK